MNYGMFSDIGNYVIQDLVNLANAAQLSDRAVLGMLEAIAKDEMYAEAMDTVVRERVFDALVISSWN
jgi:hypothetical protein